MKRPFIFWLIIILVLIFSSSVFYTYWRLTKENPLTAVVNEITKKTSSDNSKQYPDKNGVNQSEIRVLNYDIPTAYAIGKILEYQLIENPQTNETALYVQFLTEGKVLPVRVDYILSGGKGRYYFIVQELNQEQKEKVGKMLDEGRAGPPLVASNYLTLVSIHDTAQKKLCQGSFGSVPGEKWCKFDPDKKSYTREELLKQLENHLKINDQSALGKIKFSEYFFLEGNISINLQINYQVPEEVINSLK